MICFFPHPFLLLLHYIFFFVFLILFYTMSAGSGWFYAHYNIIPCFIHSSFSLFILLIFFLFAAAFLAVWNWWKINLILFNIIFIIWYNHKWSIAKHLLFSSFFIEWMTSNWNYYDYATESEFLTLSNHCDTDTVHFTPKREIIYFILIQFLCLVSLSYLRLELTFNGAKKFILALNLTHRVNMCHKE